MIYNKDIKIYIQKEYNTKYNLFTNNCWHKSRRIIRRAKEYEARLVFCVVFFWVKCLGGMPVIAPHFYALLDGVKVDVAFDPNTEQKICRNQEVRPLVSMVRGSL